MLLNPELIQESIDRSKRFRIAETLSELRGKENVRDGRPSQKEWRRKAILDQLPGSAEAAEVQFERMMGGNELTDVAYLEKGTLCSRSVCRVVIRQGTQIQGYGTGFLVAPGVLLTNHHVLPSAAIASSSIVQFRYERDIRGIELSAVDYRLLAHPAPIIYRDLDMALVAVEPASEGGELLRQFGWLRLNPEPGKGFVGEYLTIIQHPNGERKQICVRENKLLRYIENGPYLWYQTDTMAGSSGSPVFNNGWDVVGLHHSAVPRTKVKGGKDVWQAKRGGDWKPEMGDDDVDWFANEGIRISRICHYLQEQQPGHPLAQAVLGASAPPARIETAAEPEEAQRDARKRRTSFVGRVFVPIEIRLGVTRTMIPPEPPKAPPPETAAAAGPAGPAGPAIEKVEIDQGSYSKRKGYKPRFLGSKLTVPMPKVPKLKKKNELKYWNYSVVMNEKRKLAYFSIANVDPAKFLGKRDADGDTWFKDTRIPPESQIGQEFYKKQKEFEADRTASPLDQGHLTRRSDVQWGKDLAEAKRNGDDSYHYTNCAPQHWQFNQNSKASGIWFRLEESAIKTLSPGGKLCLINGPVFDAPLCVKNPDGTMRLNLNGKRMRDGTFGKADGNREGVQIPRMFFKVIAYAQGGKVCARAFVVTQEELLRTIDHYYPPQEATVLTDLEVRLYQVSIADLEKLTGLEFGSLAQKDGSGGEESMEIRKGAPIQDEGEIVF